MIKEKLEQAVWILRTLFQLGKTSGSTGNISFREEDKIYIFPKVGHVLGR